MLRVLSRMLREEKGQALPIALAMLALGSLIVTPLLNLTETSLRSGINEEDRMYEHYAANAGISDGLRNIVTDAPQLPAAGDNWSYSINSTNDRTVDVIIGTIDDSNWKVTSTATSDNGRSTELNCWVEEKSCLPNAITTTSITINNAAVVNGNVQWDSELGTWTNRGTINGQIIDKAVAWPTTEEVEGFYLEQVEGAPTHEGDLTLVLGPETLTNPYSLGPIYINGSLGISIGPAAVRLDGTVYVNGSVSINRDVNLYMNNNTIFSEGNFAISPNANIYESGCIVCIPILSFDANTDPDSRVLFSSVAGEANIGYAGKTIYGAAYSPDRVSVARDSTLTYMECPPEVSIPPLPGRSFKIVRWESRRY